MCYNTKTTLNGMSHSCVHNKVELHFEYSSSITYIMHVIFKIKILMQVWGLFAPKFVFDVVGLILSDFLICLASVYYLV